MFNFKLVIITILEKEFRSSVLSAIILPAIYFSVTIKSSNEGTGLLYEIYVFFLLVLDESIEHMTLEYVKLQLVDFLLFF